MQLGKVGISHWTGEINQKTLKLQFVYEKERLHNSKCLCIYVINAVYYLNCILYTPISIGVFFNQIGFFAQIHIIHMSILCQGQLLGSKWYMNISDTEKHESCVVKGLCVCSITQLFVDWQKRRQKKQKPTQKSDLAYTSSISLSFPQNLWKLFETKLSEYTVHLLSLYHS